MKANRPSALAALLAASVFAFAADQAPLPAVVLEDVVSDGSDAAAPESGGALLAECAARMPRERVVLGGALNMRRRYGVSLVSFNFTVDADFSLESPVFSYVFTDGNGAELLAAKAVRSADGGLSVTSSTGERLAADGRILGTDVTWLDTFMDFVNWRNPQLCGTASVKGRTCDLLDVEPHVSLDKCRKARLWIDRAQKCVMQAAQFDGEGRELRRLWIRAVQKVSDRWIFKDIEVETKDSGHRTRLHFDRVEFPDVPAETGSGGAFQND